MTHQERTTVIIVNLNRTWPEVDQGLRSAADVTLGDWNPYKSNSKTVRAFDPDDVVLVLGYRKGTFLTAYDIAEDGVRWQHGYTPERVRWVGVPSAEWEHLVGTESPVKWKQGEGVALKAMSIEQLRQSTSAAGSGSGGGPTTTTPTDEPSSQDVTIHAAGVTLTVRPPQSAEITLPQGMALSVKHTA